MHPFPHFPVAFRILSTSLRYFSSVVACCFGETLACKQAILCFNDMVAVAACFVHHLSQHHHIIASSHIHHSSIRTEDLPSHPTP
mmetsp:Transcript_15813/g.39297  ORF Transcript_15813/g.39297 Transcript_15813/m.39297 type:complete len:85 (+) Transcript_15813:778-1032(+)